MSWLPVCATERMTPDRGVAALVGDRPVAIFKLGNGELYAIDHRDPISGANVLARGLVGDHGGSPTVASPIYKQRFDLRTGRCLDADDVAVATGPVREVDGTIQVAC